jgi:NAD(P)-dependent dehydrogenase (short-subunit alcohol dehydrogenase family)
VNRGGIAFFSTVAAHSTLRWSWKFLSKSMNHPERATLRTYRDAVVLLTGGASGIGRAMAENLARRGALVVLADRQHDRVREVAEAIRQNGGEAESHTLDVTDREAVIELVAAIFDRHGRLDYLFNNAGISIGGLAKTYEPNDWDSVLGVNLRGVLHGIQAAYPRMIAQGFGHIVNTASITGLAPAPGLTCYSMTKHAVVGLSLSLRVEAAREGVRVSVLCPGLIDTPILTGGVYGRMTGNVDLDKLRARLDAMRPMDPASLAERSLRDVARNRPISVHPRRWRAAWWLHRLSPSLSLGVARRILAKQYTLGRDVPAD